MSRPTVLIPAAGEGKRFRDAGYTDPKPMITFPLHNRGAATMLQHCMDGIPDGWDVTVGVPDQCGGSYIGSRAHAAGVYRQDAMPPTRGQASTIQQLAAHLDSDYAGPIMVMNCDVKFVGHVLRQFDFLCREMRAHTGAVVVKRGHNEDEKRYSFVDGLPWFHRCAERVGLSVWAMAGAYWFDEVGTLCNLLNAGRNRLEEGAEFYLSSIWERTESFRNFAFPISDREYLEFGTPEMLAKTLARKDYV